MPRYATVTFDASRDFAHIRYLPVALATDDDVAAFAAEIDREMKAIGRKVDIVVGLGDLIVKSGAVAAYDAQRLRMFGAYARRAYRYGGSGLLRTKILTSSTIHSQSANVYATLEAAIAAMMADRAVAP